MFSVSLFIGKSGGGPFLGAVTAGTCSAGCGVGLATCYGAAYGVSGTLLAKSITAPFTSILTPWFGNGCWTGFGMCYATCVGGALVAPTE